MMQHLINPIMAIALTLSLMTESRPVNRQPLDITLYPQGYVLPFKDSVTITSGPCTPPSGSNKNWDCSESSPYHKNVSGEAMDFQSSAGNVSFEAIADQGGTAHLDYLDGFGNLVTIWHLDGSVSFYAHLSEVKIEDGHWVNQGDVIGTTGETGLPANSGNHLHYEVRQLDYVGPAPRTYKPSDLFTLGTPVKIIDNPNIQYKPGPCCNRGTAKGGSVQVSAPNTSGNPQSQNPDPAKSLKPRNPATEAAQLKPPERTKPNCGVSRAGNVVTLTFCGFRSGEKLSVRYTTLWCLRIGETLSPSAGSDGSFVTIHTFFENFNCPGQITATATGIQSGVSVTLSFNYP